MCYGTENNQSRLSCVMAQKTIRADYHVLWHRKQSKQTIMCYGTENNQSRLSCVMAQKTIKVDYHVLSHRKQWSSLSCTMVPNTFKVEYYILYSVCSPTQVGLYFCSFAHGTSSSRLLSYHREVPLQTIPLFFFLFPFSSVTLLYGFFFQTCRYTIMPEYSLTCSLYYFCFYILM